MIWYDLEIVNRDEMNYKNEMNRSDSNSGFDLYSSSNVKVEQTPQCIPFGMVARLIKVEPMLKTNDYIKTDSHFWLVPKESIYNTGLIMANSMGVIDKSYRDELKATVWSLTANSVIKRNDCLFQIVAPDMGWIRNIYLVDSI